MSDFVSVQQDTSFAVLRQLFSSDDTHGAALLTIGIKVLGIEAIQTFEPETIRLELQDFFKLKIIKQRSLDRFFAMVSILNTDLFFTDVLAFNDLCNIVSGDPTPADQFEPTDPYEMAWSVFQARIVDPLDNADDDINFSNDVRKYMGFILNEHGFISPPKILADAIMPSQAEDNANSYVADEALISGILDRNTLLITDLEEQLSSLAMELDEQIRRIAAVKIPNQD